MMRIPLKRALGGHLSPSPSLSLSLSLSRCHLARAHVRTLSDSTCLLFQCPCFRKDVQLYDDPTPEKLN
jgi:hypothetical protein